MVQGNSKLQFTSADLCVSLPSLRLKFLPFGYSVPVSHCGTARKNLTGCVCQWYQLSAPVKFVTVVMGTQSIKFVLACNAAAPPNGTFTFQSAWVCRPTFTFPSQRWMLRLFAPSNSFPVG